MALILAASLTQSSDCTVLYLNDITGVYNSVSNPGGWGTPNELITSITSASVSGTIYLPGGSTITIPITSIAPTAPNPIPLFVGESYQLTTSLLGITGTNFPDGIYVLTYSVTDGVNTFTATIQQLVTCNADCAIGSALSDIEPCDCSCNDTEELFEIFMLLMAAKCAAGQTMNSKALDDLLVVQNFFSNKGGCGCSE